MLGWINVLRKKFEKMPALAQFAIAVIIIIIIRYLLHLIIYSNYLSSYLENFGTPKSMTYFHMTGCGHCKKFSPVWDEFSSNYKGTLKLQKYEREEAGEEMLKKYQIQGFPTIILIDEQGAHKQFEGDRTVQGLESFANQ